MSSPRLLALASAISFALLAQVQLAHAASSETFVVPFLTGPQKGVARELAVAYLQSQRDALGLKQADVAEMLLKDDYATEHNGIRHLYWRQQHSGIEVWNGDLAINVARDGSIINLHNAFVSDLSAKVNTTEPTIEATDAIFAAAASLGLASRTPLLLLQSEAGPARAARYAGGELSADDIPVRLMYEPSMDRNSVSLAWELVIREKTGSNWWSIRIDAQTGEVIGKASFVAHVDQDEKTPTGAGVQYRVFPFPAEHPGETSHNIVSDPADTLASPFGWHDTNGVAGNEFSDTRGNNVVAQDDVDANNSGGSRPTGTGASPLLFDFAFDDAAEPEVGSNLNAAIVNLFYWNNIMHDVTYQYGFTEAAGNFQTNNYGRGGSGNDAVQADALDGLNTGSNNNANFGTPPDGSAPRMQMFRWLAPVEVAVSAPVVIAGNYPGVAAGFGPIFSLAGLPGDLQLVDDGVAPGSDGCTASTPGSLTGKIAVIDRGGCEFGTKARRAQEAGAIGAIVVNNAPGPAAGMGPGVDGAAVTIRALMVSQDDGNLIKAQLPAPGVTVLMRTTLPHRDSDLDAGIIGHEYGHGISNRLTGGPSNTSCLQTTISGGESEQGGEGWSDFWALVLHAKPSDTRNTPRFVGTYPSFQSPASGPGIRNFPYSTNPTVSPQTYANVGSTNAPHGVGEIWAGALWNVYWNLVDRYGFDANLYTGTGGNNLMIKLVVDGMKLQPCSPTMIAARDAILQADIANNAGANQCAIWNGFAAKGMGFGALPGTFLRGNETPSFALPLVCDRYFVNGFED